jgi:hypothetical protein
VLWLATSIVHAANARRPNESGVKTGGHQASGASLVSVMTALWFDGLTAAERVSVKPHASPVLHAINYLLGRLDASYLPRLRDFGGLYPIRTDDPARRLLHRLGHAQVSRSTTARPAASTRCTGSTACAPHIAGAALDLVD